MWSKPRGIVQIELKLTKKQTEYLNKTSLIKTEALKRTYIKSVEVQPKTLKAAEQLHKKQK